MNEYQSGFQNDKIKLTHDFLVDFSLKWPEKVEFSISVILDNFAWGAQKWRKLQIQDLLNKVNPKEQIFKMTLFSLQGAPDSILRLDSGRYYIY